MILKISLIVVSTLAFSFSFSQYKKAIPHEGILPFTGAKFDKHGMGGEAFEIKLAEETWTSNRLPIDTGFEIKLLNPTGLKLGDDQNVHPGIELLIILNAKDTLANLPNIFTDKTIEGFEPETLKSLTVSLKFNDIVKTGDSCQIWIKFFDAESSNHVNLDFQVFIVDSKIPLEISDSTFSFISTDGILGASSKIGFQSMEIIKDPKTKKINLEIVDLENTSVMELKNGTTEIWQYNSKMERGKLSNAEVIYEEDELPKIIIKNKLDSKNMKYIRYRWTSHDKSKIIDLIGETRNY